MSYSFLRESKLYLVYGGTKYNIRTTSSITFNQTFAEDSYSVKTLHDQSKMFEGSTITKANPANFSFEVPLTTEKDESIVIDLLSDLVDSEQLKSFDMYVQTGSSTFKLENAVVTAGNFTFSPSNQFLVAIDGEGTKLSRVGDESFSIPGSAQSETSTRNPLLIYPVVSFDSLDMSSIIGLTLRISNNIEWTAFETLHDSLSVTNSSNAMFPSAYTLGTRTVSGEIRQYQTDNNNTQFDDFSTSSDLTIKAVKVGEASNATPFFQIQLNPISYTARMQPGEAYIQSYDFTSTDNTALGTRITQYS
jgi:hypothetical protein